MTRYGYEGKCWAQEKSGGGQLYLHDTIVNGQENSIYKIPGDFQILCEDGDYYIGTTEEMDTSLVWNRIDVIRECDGEL